jgi:predicted nucleic acid-binding protein
MTIVVDASVATKWFVQERGTAQADALRTDTIIAPDLVIPETMNAIWKNVRLGRISIAQSRQIGGILPACFHELAGSSKLASRALEISLELDHPVYDGFYLALAQQENAQFVTADERLFQKTRKTKFTKLLRPLMT